MSSTRLTPRILYVDSHVLLLIRSVKKHTVRASSRRLARNVDFTRARLKMYISREYNDHSFNLQKQETLPALPVPDLETTMQKYLAQVEVIAPHHLERTRSLVRAFLSGPGPKLQQRLLERRQKTDNWVSGCFEKCPFERVSSTTVIRFKTRVCAKG